MDTFLSVYRRQFLFQCFNIFQGEWREKAAEDHCYTNFQSGWSIYLCLHFIVCFLGKMEKFQRCFQIFRLNLSGGLFFCFAAEDWWERGIKGSVQFVVLFISRGTLSYQF